MTTPAAGAPATEAPPSQAQVPGLRGRPEERRRKTKARCQAPGATSSPSTPPGSNVALVVIHCDPLNPPGPPSPEPSGESTGKNQSWAGQGDSSGESPAYPE